jgi:hypothetical protein
MDFQATCLYGFHSSALADLTSSHPVTKEDIQEHFKTHGTGNITEVKLMNGFGFVEYDDPMDARDVVPGMKLQLPIINLLLTSRSFP